MILSIIVCDFNCMKWLKEDEKQNIVKYNINNSFRKFQVKTFVMYTQKAELNVAIKY